MFVGLKNSLKNLQKDIFLLTLSVAMAIWMIKSDTLVQLLTEAEPKGAYLGALIAGIFFTSIFTTAPALVLLGKIAAYSGAPFLVALFGSTGAVLGDMLIFEFVHDRLRSDIFALAGKRWSDKIRHIFRKKIYHHWAPIIAATIIASPLPDELGLAIIGMDGRKMHSFELFSFIANFAGILIISLIAVSIT